MLEFEEQEIKKNELPDIIIAMIVNIDFLNKIRPLYSKEYFTNGPIKRIAEWCIEYYDKYKKPVGKDIISLIESKKDSVNESELEIIKSILDNFNDSYVSDKQFNVDFYVDRAILFFKKNKLDLFINKLRAVQLNNDYEKADEIISNWERIEKTENHGVDFLDDIEKSIEAIDPDKHGQALITFQGDLGKFIRPFRRQDMVAWVGPGKRGKTFFLIEMAVLGLLNENNVWFITLEMRLPELLVRLNQRINGMASSIEYPDKDFVEVNIPYFDRSGNVYKRHERRKVLNKEDVSKKLKSLRSFTSGKLKLDFFPEGSLKASEIRTHLNNYKNYNVFVPDIILIDYPDILMPERKADPRQQIDETWKEIRRLGQETNSLIGVVSHSPKITQERDIKKGDLSEDVRKANHVTWMGAINKNEQDEEDDVVRIKLLYDRHRKVKSKKEVYIIQCLDVGGIILDSRFKEEY